MNLKERERAEERRRKKKKKSRKHHKSTQYSSDSSPPTSSSFVESSSFSEGERRHNRKHKKNHRQESTDPPPSSDGEHERRKRRKRRRDTEKIQRAEKNPRKEDKEERKKGHHTSKRGRHRDEKAYKDAAKLKPNRHVESSEDDLPSPEEVVSSILHKFPEIANDLEQLLKILDDGQAVDISGLTNKHIAAYLQELFRSLRLHKTSQGLFLLPEGVSQKTVDILGPFLHTNSIASVHELNAQSESKKQGGKDEFDRSEQDDKRLGQFTDGESLLNHDHPGPSEQRRRVLGPAMPSTEMLEAAARLTEAGSSLREAEEELELDPLIGPPPPAAVVEAESANEAERFEEVERILAPDIENAYELLGLRVGTTPELLKKRYWKLSLLVHPDKCTHPQAHQAFTALNQAFKDLQDPTKRSLIDQKIQDKEAREEFEAELKAKREAAQWRKIRGEALPGDDLLLDTPKAPTRDEWMTQLPPERKAGAPPMQSTFFSKSGKSGRGDTSVWTDTPLEKAQKAKTAYLEAYKQATLTADTNDNKTWVAARRDHDSQEADIMDKFNTARRATSLFEKHQQERSKKIKKTPNKEAPPPAEWSGNHPWKPWDREKDLTSGRQSVNLDRKNMSEGLSLRFSSSHEERSFL